MRAAAQHFKESAVDNRPAFRDITLIYLVTRYIPMYYSLVRQPEMRNSWTFANYAMHCALSKARRHERGPSLSTISNQTFCEERFVMVFYIILHWGMKRSPTRAPTRLT